MEDRRSSAFEVYDQQIGKLPKEPSVTMQSWLRIDDNKLEVASYIPNVKSTIASLTLVWVTSWTRYTTWGVVFSIGIFMIGKVCERQLTSFAGIKRKPYLDLCLYLDQYEFDPVRWVTIPQVITAKTGVCIYPILCLQSMFLSVQGLWHSPFWFCLIPLNQGLRAVYSSCWSRPARWIQRQLQSKCNWDTYWMIDNLYFCM